MNPSSNKKTKISLNDTTEVNGDGRIEKSEAVNAVMDYFSGIITR